MRLKNVGAVLIFTAFVLTAFLGFRVFAQGSASALSFATQDWGYVIFDHTQARIYVYNARNGELTAVWKINRLGDSLERIQ